LYRLSDVVAQDAQDAFWIILHHAAYYDHQVSNTLTYHTKYFFSFHLKGYADIIIYNKIF